MSRSGSATAGAAVRYDAMFKRLFNESRMAGDLLQAIAPDRFLAAVDLGTLCQAGGEFADDRQRSSRADRIWRVKSKSGGDWVYLFVLIEFQSRVDPMMARRVLNYVLRAREQAEGERREDGLHSSLPPVVPVVIYSGDAEWSAPTDYLDLIEGDDEWLLEYQTRQRYDVIELRRADAGEYPEGNAVGALCALSNPGSTEPGAKLAAMLRTALGPEHKGLRDAFIGLALAVVEHSCGIPQEALDELKRTEAMQDHEEVASVFERSFDRAFDKVRTEGRAEGRAEGRTEGRTEGHAEGRVEGHAEGHAEGRTEGRVDGMREILRRQAARKFGLSRRAALSELFAGLRTADQLEGASEFLLDCEDADEFVRVLQRNSGGG